MDYDAVYNRTRTCFFNVNVYGDWACVSSLIRCRASGVRVQGLGFKVSDVPPEADQVSGLII
jgi:hypothetical protein